MENNLNLNSVKAPAPNLSKNKAPEENKTKRTIKRPNVGVVSPPNISTTPIFDTMVQKKNENPRKKYKLTQKKHSFFNMQNIISTCIVALGAVSLLSAGKNIKNFFKK